MNILSQLEEHADDYDLQAMDTLVEALSLSELSANKQEIIKIYNMVYASARYDLDCGKVDAPKDFVIFLLNIIGSVQRFFPDQLYYQERGCCYEDLAYCAITPEDKLSYIQQAIHIYNTAPQTTGIQLSMVRALIDKMEITEEFTTDAFTELLSFFTPVLRDSSHIKGLIQLCFRVRFLSFEQHPDWYQHLRLEFEEAMHGHAKNNLFIYLTWAEIYHSILNQDPSQIDPAYRADMIAQTVTLLNPLKGYDTADPELLFRLGEAFANTAKRLTDSQCSLEFYQAAVLFFTKNHKEKRILWDFPVYVINILPDMAHIYHKQGDYEKVIHTFENGLQLFSQADNPSEDSQLNIYWGDFLIEYSGLVYDYQSPSLNSQAEEKLRLALTLLGEYGAHPHFSRPYFSMARLAIRSGDKEKCVALLLQCKAFLRSKGYSAYELHDALNDEDFREVWSLLQ